MQDAPSAFFWPQPAETFSPTHVLWIFDSDEQLTSFVAGTFEEVENGDAIQAYVAPVHAAVASETISAQMPFVSALLSVVGKQHTIARYIEVPVLRWPIVVQDAVLLPEKYFVESLQGPTVMTELERDTQFSGEIPSYQTRAFRLARGWLQGNLLFRDDAYVSNPFPTISDRDNPLYGEVWIREALAHYLSLRIVDAMLHTERLDEVMQARIDRATRYRDDPQLPMTSPLVDMAGVAFPPTEASWEFNQVFAAVGALDLTVGRQELGTRIGQWVTDYEGQTVGLSDWIEYVNRLYGAEVSAEFETLANIRSQQVP